MFNYPLITIVAYKIRILVDLAGRNILIVIDLVVGESSSEHLSLIEEDVLVFIKNLVAE